MKNKLFSLIQIITGIMLLVFGLNIFLQFIPMGEPTPEMADYMKALFSTGFLFPLIAVIEILAGIAFITNKFTPLLAIIMLPIIINAFLAHLFLDLPGIAGALFVLISIIIIMIRYKDRYKNIFEI